MSKLKKKHCKNNGCNLSPLTAEQDLSYEEILVSPYYFVLFLKTQYMRNSCIVYTIKIQSVFKGAIFGFKIMVKRQKSPL